MHLDRNHQAQRLHLFGYAFADDYFAGSPGKGCFISAEFAVGPGCPGTEIRSAFHLHSCVN